MDIFSFILPPTILIICLTVIIVVILAFKLSADMREIRRSRDLYRKLIEIAKRASRKTISIVIELNQSADKLIPLLDDLYGQRYPKLEVIVIIKHTAGRAAQAKLKYYRQKNSLKKFKIIKHVKGMSLAVAIKKYATGYLVLPICATSKLSNNFLDDVSLSSLSSTRDVMTIKTIPALGNSLTSAVVAHFNVWRVFFDEVRPRTFSKVQTGLVYKRSALKDDIIYRGQLSHAAHRATIITPVVSFAGRDYIKKVLASASSYIFRPYIFTSALLAVIALVVLLFIMGADDGRMLLGFIFIAYVITHIGLVIRLKAYSVQDRISLALLAPFSIVYGLVLVLAAPIKVLMDFIISLLPKKPLQKRLNNNNQNYQ